MLFAAHKYIENEQEAEAADYAEYFMRQPARAPLLWVPRRRARPQVTRTRDNNPWRNARRVREEERLDLLAGKEV